MNLSKPMSKLLMLAAELKKEGRITQAEKILLKGNQPLSKTNKYLE